ncbi:hypothetical protein KSF_107500 [Reticulibacter mediterranei]|uniref:Uncharacterized protein n=1 Tax=Reticulibacter mediterranei TaxID=2778369 RepID=A0A8J3N6T3_9CHLR|nr:hypothetical protein [Reticulibacter mediterranei]GHP00703.1 hypothetical protein KSF_107500 [Reticulibacter mediterranei]
MRKNLGKNLVPVILLVSYVGFVLNDFDIVQTQHKDLQQIIPTMLAGLAIAVLIIVLQHFFAALLWMDRISKSGIIYIISSYIVLKVAELLIFIYLMRVPW